MAMTKAEQALLEAARTEAALRWTDAVERDVPPPKPGGYAYRQYTDGYDFNLHSMTIQQMWSSSIHHGSGPSPIGDRGNRSASQGARHLFSTRERALRAMRHAVELKAAKDLRNIDISIEAETKPTMAEKIESSARRK